jgi:hypothetical protein
MSDESSFDVCPDEHGKLLERRLFLQSMGKWSGAAIAAAVFGSVWFAGPPTVQAGWINRRGGGGYGGGWINGRGGWGGGGSWVNGGGGGWVNRRNYGGGGSWINRW